MSGFLKKPHLEGFKSWLTAEGVRHRDPRGEYQVLQVELPNGQWACLYEKARDTQNAYTVDRRLEPLVERFIAQTSRVERKGAFEPMPDAPW